MLGIARAQRLQDVRSGASISTLMNWIDRLALAWAAILWLLFYGLASGHGEPTAAVNIETLKAVAFLAGAPWLFLRGIRWIAQRH